MMQTSQNRRSRHDVEERLRSVLEGKEASRGMLIALEGPGGSGKTIQRKLLKDWLRTEGQRVAVTKWGSSDLIKPIIKARKKIHALSPREYCLLHAADFHLQLENEILPALWEGKHVIADGYLFSALARDSAAGLDLDWVLNAYAPLFWPDAVIYFAVSPETSGRRLWQKKLPTHYDLGQDITGIEDPFASYEKFVRRMIEEYEALSLIFKFVRIDAEEAVFDQHRALRRMIEQAGRRRWAEWNCAAILAWIRQNPQAAEAYFDG